MTKLHEMASETVEVNKNSTQDPFAKRRQEIKELNELINWFLNEYGVKN